MTEQKTYPISDEVLLMMTEKCVLEDQYQQALEDGAATRKLIKMRLALDTAVIKMHKQIQKETNGGIKPHDDLVTSMTAKTVRRSTLDDVLEKSLTRSLRRIVDAVSHFYRTEMTYQEQDDD